MEIENEKIARCGVVAGHICGGDVASYLTGARLRFGTHLINNSMKESEFYVQQVSTGKTVHIKLNPEVYPAEVKTQMILS